MKPLLFGYCGPSLTGFDRPEIGLWAEIYRLISVNISHIDRMGRIKFPFDFRLDESCRLPAEIGSFSDSYEDCCRRRTQELAARAERLGVPIALFYSGGIDSTLLVVCFAQLLGSQMKDRVKVFLSPESVRENPTFYHSFIRRNCRIAPSEEFSSLFDRSHIIVNGEHNDQLFGSDVIGMLGRYEAFDEVRRPYTRKTIVRLLKHGGIGEEAANAWFTLLDEHARHAPCPVRTVFEFFWWLNFVFKWQSVYYRMPMRMSPAQHANVDRAFLDTYYQTFFNTADFQKWSMANPELKVQQSWSTYKFPAKRMIYEFNRDEHYFKHKIKTGSLFRLFLQKRAPIGLTTDFEFVHEIDPGAMYLPDNDFRALLAEVAPT